MLWHVNGCGRRCCGQDAPYTIVVIFACATRQTWPAGRAHLVRLGMFPTHIMIARRSEAEHLSGDLVDRQWDAEGLPQADAHDL